MKGYLRKLKITVEYRRIRYKIMSEEYLSNTFQAHHMYSSQISINKSHKFQTMRQKNLLSAL